MGVNLNDNHKSVEKNAKNEFKDNIVRSLVGNNKITLLVIVIANHPLAPILETVESHVPLFVQFSLLPYPHTVEFVQLVFVDTAKFELKPPLIAPNPPEIRPSTEDLTWVMKD
ncbi:MAG: hypothetical protein H6Q26_86 [Bacteroidetes bacterium]|nr:hypothetical protein [Bacteroidota bacterium]